MGKQFNPLFAYSELGSFIIFLPLICLINVLTFLINLNKAGRKKCAALGGLIMSMLQSFIGATRLLREQFWKQAFGKAEIETTLNVPSASSERAAMRRALFQSVAEKQICRSMIKIPTSTPVGHGTDKVLGLVNDTPASSDKYEFARALAEKLIAKSMLKGGGGSQDINKSALEAAFSRTVGLLTLALEELQQQQEMKDSNWLWALIHSVFLKNVGIFQQKLCFIHLYTHIHSIVARISMFSKAATELPPVQLSATNPKGFNVCAHAEKLALELLWVTEKLKDCSSLREIVRRWGAMHHLARLSLSAHPRIQACLMRVSAMLLKELAVSEPNTWSSSLKVDVLLLWLPLFCHAKIGFEYPYLMPFERIAVSKNLEQTIFRLSMMDQERVLACWLREYMSSTSEWPNLQECFEGWYFATRA